MGNAKQEKVDFESFAEWQKLQSNSRGYNDNIRHVIICKKSFTYK